MGAAPVVAVATGCLQKPRRCEAEQQSAREHRHWLSAPEVLDVRDNPVRVRLLQVAADALTALGGLIGKPRRRLLALPPQLVADRADITRC